MHDKSAVVVHLISFLLLTFVVRYQCSYEFAASSESGETVSLKGNFASRACRNGFSCNCASGTCTNGIGAIDDIRCFLS